MRRRRSHDEIHVAVATTSAPEQRKRQILDAAVRVFARNGYHASRVGDVAEEAGVAYGLVYHYFDSKEAVLGSIFVETWTGMLGTIEAIEAGEAGGPAEASWAVHGVLRYKRGHTR